MCFWHYLRVFQWLDTNWGLEAAACIVILYFLTGQAHLWDHLGRVVGLDFGGVVLVYWPTHFLLQFYRVLSITHSLDVGGQWIRWTGQMPIEHKVVHLLRNLTRRHHHTTLVLALLLQLLLYFLRKRLLQLLVEKVIGRQYWRSPWFFYPHTHNQVISLLIYITILIHLFQFPGMFYL